jgi:hypothetical protein
MPVVVDERCRLHDPGGEIWIDPELVVLAAARDLSHRAACMRV